ncbi:hypothetical protein CEXT_686751 [Caerostris extrusa]|uniref:Uncharacterized protein n=1 Tax=Caerostris extrusa TaxID=172846 RepID=A0AAV4N8L6_CAEEX|nr:hypothetical protein CEXT_686751 [Caerostris extrusa]
MRDPGPKNGLQGRPTVQPQAYRNLFSVLKRRKVELGHQRNKALVVKSKERHRRLENSGSFCEWPFFSATEKNTQRTFICQWATPSLRPEFLEKCEILILFSNQPAATTHRGAALIAIASMMVDVPVMSA